MKYVCRVCGSHNKKVHLAMKHTKSMQKRMKERMQIRDNYLSPERILKRQDEQLIGVSKFNEGIVNFQTFILQITDAIEQLEREVKSIREDMEYKKSYMDD